MQNSDHGLGWMMSNLRDIMRSQVEWRLIGRSPSIFMNLNEELKQQLYNVEFEELDLL